jgi:hypothetical protein
MPALHTVVLPSDVAAYNAWATACIAAGGEAIPPCDFVPGPDNFFPDLEPIYSWGGLGSTNNNERWIVFDDPWSVPEGEDPDFWTRVCAFVPITAPFVLSSLQFSLSNAAFVPVITQDLLDGLGWGDQTVGGNATQYGATVPRWWNNQNSDFLFTNACMCQVRHNPAGTEGLDDVLPTTDSAMPVIAEPSVAFAIYTDTTFSYGAVPIGTQTAETLAITINPGDTLRFNFYDSGIGGALYGPAVVYGPITVALTGLSQFWTAFNKTQELSE